MKNGKVWLAVGLGCGGMAGLALLAACAGLMITGVRSAWSANGEISAAVDDLLRAAANGTFTRTYQSDAAPELRQAISAADYAKLGELIKSELGSLKSKQLVRVNLRQLNANSFAEVVYQGTFDRGSGTIHATLKRSGARWLFVSLRVDSPKFLKDLPDQTCPQCGGAYASSARFCPHCGKAAPAAEKH